MFDALNHPVSLELPRRMTRAAAWIGHIPFGMALIDLLRPGQLVELGTYWGDSYCAFCQAVAKLGLQTRCVAVDSWRGDEHTGEYGAFVLEDLRAHHDPLYSSFSTLKQAMFDEAVSDFADGSIDLLHIDGLHTYDAVRHDFETWMPKISARGVVIFHDTAERKEGFGVWRFWEEIASQYPAFEFTHSHGLGVLAVGAGVPDALRAFFAAARENPERMRLIYHTLGERVSYCWMASAGVQGLFAIQQSINAHKRARGKPVNPKSESFEAAWRVPVDFSEYVRTEVGLLLTKPGK